MKIATDFTGDNIWSLHRERDSLNREIKSCEPSRRKKMRYLSHFRLFIKTIAFYKGEIDHKKRDDKPGVNIRCV